MSEAEEFGQIYQDYLKAVAQIDFNAIKDSLGVQVIAGEALIPFYGITHRISGVQLSYMGEDPRWARG